jgi:hypothetical protein
MGRADLSSSVIILPPGGFGADSAGDASGVVDRLKAWVRTGGTLIAWAACHSDQLAGGLVGDSAEGLAREAAPAAGGRPPRRQATPTAAARSRGRRRRAGRATSWKTAQPTQNTNWLSGPTISGPIGRRDCSRQGRPGAVGHRWSAGKLNVLFDGRGFTPLKQDKGINAVVFSTPDDLLASGYPGRHVSNRAQTIVMVQSEGRCCCRLYADPNFRAFMDGLNVCSSMQYSVDLPLRPRPWRSGMRNGIIGPACPAISQNFRPPASGRRFSVRPSKRPNVLVVMLDDFGIGQCSPYRRR